MARELEGDYIQTSDINLTIEYKGDVISLSEQFENSALPFSVDIVDMKLCKDKKIYQHILSDGIMLINEHIDQFLFRFSKLQDVMGEKLFPTVLMLLAEDIKRKSFIDILNRLEALGLLDANGWLCLRKIRNSVVDEYGFNVVDMVESLNAIYQSCASLLNIYDGIHAFCLQRFDFIH